MTSKQVERFINDQERRVREDLYSLIDLLIDFGHAVGMPYAKPIGKGLWELRRAERPQMRILYGFCKDTAILLVAFKKQQSAIDRPYLERAQKYLKVYCS